MNSFMDTDQYAYRHFTTKAFWSNLIRIKGFHLCIIEEKPFIFIWGCAISDKAIIMTTISCPGVYSYTNQIIVVPEIILLKIHITLKMVSNSITLKLFSYTPFIEFFCIWRALFSFFSCVRLACFICCLLNFPLLCLLFLFFIEKIFLVRHVTFI